MLRPESIRKHEINGITVEHRSQTPGPHSQFALDLNYVVMHLLNSATLEIVRRSTWKHATRHLRGTLSVPTLGNRGRLMPNTGTFGGVPGIEGRRQSRLVLRMPLFCLLVQSA